MDELLNSLLEAAKPHLTELVTVLLTAGIAWLRIRLQVRAAEGATLEVELKHRAKVAAGEEKLPGEQRRKLAELMVQQTLPVLAQPLTRKGMQRLVEKRVRKAHKKADAMEAATQEPEA